MDAAAKPGTPAAPAEDQTPASWPGAGAGDLTRDHFALFGLPQRFELDPETLRQSWRRLQAAAHPDRFAAAGAAAARVAMQWSTWINTAYRTLLDPQSRAAYLCELRGVAVDAQRNTAMPGAFLEQQMQWRERLDELRAAADGTGLQALAAEVGARRDGVLRSLGELLDVQQPDAERRAAATREAAQLVRALMFLDKFSRDLGTAAAGLPSHAGATS